MKRALDILVAVWALTLLAPLFVLVTILIKATSRGPAIFRQERVGQEGRPFVLLKFRTMRDDADDGIHRDYVSRLLKEDVPPAGGLPGLYKLDRDPRVTWVGSWLRRASLDELPQLVNVLRGEMSLVGPRPGLAWEVELYEDRHHVRLVAKPGLAGLPQVSGRNYLSMRDALDLDVEYVRHRCLHLDLLILARMLIVVIRGGGAR